MSSIQSCNIRSPNGIEEVCCQIIVTDTSSPLYLQDVMLEDGFYTFSFYVYANILSFMNVAGTKIRVTQNWQYNSLRLIRQDDSLEIYFELPGTYYLYHPILEKGNKPTQWTPSPLDVDESLNTIDKRVTQEREEIDASIVLTKKNILSTVSDTYATKETVTSVDNKFSNYSTTSEMKSQIDQSANSVLSTVSNTYATIKQVTDVDGKFSNYTTTSDMQSEINQSKNDILSTVSSTYATKESVTDVDGKFSSYSTTTQMNSAIDQKANDITSSVSQTYATISKVNDVDGKFSSYSTTEQMNSAINQSAVNITSTVNNKFDDYSTTSEMNSAISQSADSITQNVSSTYATKEQWSATENKLTPTALITTISSALAGSDTISTTKFVMDANGLLIKNGGFKIQNNNGAEVFSTDTNGNVNIVGTFRSKWAMANCQFITINGSNISCRFGTNSSSSGGDISYDVFIGGSDSYGEMLIDSDDRLRLSGNQITLTGATTINDGLFVNGTATVSSLRVNGSSTFSSSITVPSITANGSSTLYGTTTVSTLSAGNISSSSLSTSGAISASGNITTSGTLTCDTLHSNGAISMPTGYDFSYGTTVMPRMFAGTIVTNVGGSDSVQICTSSGLNSTFGVSNVSNSNTAVFICNGDGGAASAHSEGVTYLSGGSWNATFSKAIPGMARINYLVVYFG